MDLDYISARQKHSLHMAVASTSKSARVAHRAFAKAYDLILAARYFPSDTIATEAERQQRGGQTRPEGSADLVSQSQSGTANDAA